MRISTSQMFERGTSDMISRQSKVSNIQNQLSRGARVGTAADDPIASANIEVLSQRQNRTQMYQSNNVSIAGALNNQQGAMSSIVTTIQSLQEIQIQAGSPVLSDADRKSLAAQGQSLLEQLRSLSNSTDLDGNYVFGGSRANVAPIDSSYNYTGDNTQRYQAISDNLQIPLNDTGDNLFMRIPAGNGSFAVAQTANPNNGAVTVSAGGVTDPANYIPDTYSLSITGNVVTATDSAGNTVYNAPYQSGADITFRGMTVSLSGTAADGQTFSLTSGKNESIFATVQKMIDSLTRSNDTAADQAFIQTQNNQVTSQLSSAIDNIASYLSDLGSRLNLLDATTTTNDNLSVITLDTIQKLQGADPTSQISMAVEYNREIATLQASQQSFARIQGLSLFNYL